MASGHIRSIFCFNILPFVALVTIAFNVYIVFIRHKSLPKPLNHYSNEKPTSFAQIIASNTTFKINGYTHFPAGKLADTEDVVIIVKTGATEIYRALPIHLTTTLTKIPNYLLFSDHKQQIAQYKVQDALDEVSEDIMLGNEDFDLYFEQKKLIALGQSPEKLELKGGWNLDKYKNIHMMKKTWQQKPHAKWYQIGRAHV